MNTTIGEKDVSTTVLLNASREQVFEAWINPDQLAQWWGPRGFRNTFEVFEPKPDGDWKFVMHGPDGTDYDNHNVFREVRPNERIVIEHLHFPPFKLTGSFEDEGGCTRLTFYQEFATKEVFDQVKSYCIEGNQQNLERLQDLLAKLHA
ncbi:activator of HSP90 ATPase [Cohnella xylanilytica]|uniref:SRPBCC family protein n=1 Tax=Cohnella xylanilytica TaxID=557555 RepID=UPI001B086538|nr:SRPBCC family protein [Cohnella xylanilytica]GIO13022.1 activator of HSP90 ATPase [Cohnella xylanilytica]